MSLWMYLRDKFVPILLNIIGIFFVIFYLNMVGNKLATLIVIGVPWVLIVITYFCNDYLKRKIHFDRILDLLNTMDKPYLVGELLENNYDVNDILYKEIIQLSTKGMINRINQIESAQKEYQEFIEGWIHEVKLPLSGLRLVNEKVDKEDRLKIENYICKLESDVEKALFFARSDEVYKDFQISEISLDKLINELLKKYKYMMIQNNMSASVEVDTTVYSDPAWLDFILGQLVFNAIKYRKEDGSSISFCTVEYNEGVELLIKDTGIGINASEIERVFDKGFTGTNGRSRGKSTGLGLYLCKKLCVKLGLDISVESVVGEYTLIKIVFPKNAFLSKL